MDLYPTILKNILLPMADLVRGTEVVKNYEWLQETQWWTSRNLEELQNEKLRNLIAYAYENVPYYEQIFRERKLTPQDIKTVKDLHKLPFLTKQIVLENFPDKIVSRQKIKALTIYTSGSSGNMLKLYRDMNAFSVAWAAFFRYCDWMGINVGERIINLWGNPIIIPEGKKIKRKIENLLFRRKTISAFKLTETDLKGYIDEIRSFKPRLVRGYTSALDVLALFMEQSGIDDLKPVAISTTAERLFPFQKTRIESAFGCKIFDNYGCGESLSVAFECDAHNGYHVTDEHVIIETIPINISSPSGAEEVVLTNLDNYTMPFIRYKNGDLAIKKHENCPCGRGLSMLQSVEGRISDVMITKDGKVVHGEFFTHILNESGLTDILGIKQFQVIQEVDGRIVLKIVSNREATKEETKQILEECYNYLGNVDVEIEFVDFIQLSETGKFRFTISKAHTKS